MPEAPCSCHEASPGAIRQTERSEPGLARYAVTRGAEVERYEAERLIALLKGYVVFGGFLHEHSGAVIDGLLRFMES